MRFADADALEAMSPAMLCGSVAVLEGRFCTCGRGPSMLDCECFKPAPVRGGFAGIVLCCTTKRKRKSDE